MRHGIRRGLLVFVVALAAMGGSALMSGLQPVASAQCVNCVQSNSVPPGSGNPGTIVIDPLGLAGVPISVDPVAAAIAQLIFQNAVYQRWENPPISNIDPTGAGLSPEQIQSNLRAFFAQFYGAH